MCAVAEADLGFKKGAGLAAGVFLMLEAAEQSFGSSPLAIFFPFLPPLCFSLPPFRSVHPAESSPFSFCPAWLLPP